MRVSSSTSSSDARRFVVRALALTAAVALTCAAVHRLDGLADVDVVGDKLAHFRAHAADYDTVFVGSSYVYREISPEVFDAVTARAGMATHSFNFGVPGMDPPETYFVVDRVLDAAGGRLKTVFVELDYFRAEVRDRNVHTRRFDYWHDASRTVQVGRGLVESDLPVTKRVKDAWFHAEAFARETLAVGRGRSLVAALVGRADAAPATLGARGDGFRSLDEEQAQRFELRRGFYQALEEDRYADKLATLRTGGDAEDAREHAGAIDLVALRATVERVRAAGARCVLVVPPCLAPRADLRELPAGADVFAFNLPDAYPELYDTKYRFDLGHLDAEGAAIFSRVLAERVVDGER
jgi:hypothetical protein